jgi:hypothetical protein
LRLRFDRYINGAYVGYTTVDRGITLSGDGQQAAGPVSATFHAADGSVLFRLCGNAVSQRL